MLNQLLALIASVALVITPLHPSTTPDATYSIENKRGDEAFEIVRVLESFGPRVTGTEQEKRSADYIHHKFTSYGLASSEQPFDFTVTDSTTLKKKTIKSKNIFAVIQGKSDKRIIIGAHYDSVKSGKGVDDNASGVAVMLETAERITISKNKPEYTLIFIAFGAEETGLNGSKAYVKAMNDKDRANTIVMINLDSLVAGNDMNVYGDIGKMGVYRDLALDYAANNKIPLETNVGENPDLPKGTTGDWSDHAPFKSVGIQHVYFESTDWSLGDKDGYTQVSEEYGIKGEIWHTPYDTIEYLDDHFPGRTESRLSSYVELVEYLALYAPQ